MDKNYLNKKWLAGDLTEEEKEAFDKIEDNDLLKKIVDKAPAFSASNFYEAQDYQVLKEKMQTKKTVKRKANWVLPLLRIAAVLVVAFGIYFYYFSNNSISIETAVTEKREVNLPDASQVILNAVSEITYNEKTWKENRELELEGEAFFKVEKGSKFDVVTSTGKVTVVGTQFNVKDRKNFFEVSCFEGKVNVTYNKKVWHLLPGNFYSVINGKVSYGTISNREKPYWVNNTSYFKKVPFHEVVEELERQYGVDIIMDDKDENLLFTGGFAHNNLSEALHSITTPLKLEYKMETPTKILLSHSE
jgi:transmembrane sensor